MVAALRESAAGVPAASRTRAQEALGQPIDLYAGVVDVELAGDRVAASIRAAPRGVAQRRARARGPHGAGPVGLAETNSTFTFVPAPRAERPNVAPVAQDPLNARGQLIVGQPEINETVARNFHFCNEFWRQLQLLHHPLGGLPGIAPLAPGQDHSQVRGEVAVAGIAGPFEDELHAIAAELRRYPRELRT